MFTKISSININNNPGKSLVQAKKIENAESKFGHLLVLLEINEPDQYGHKINETIIESLKRNYYSNDKMTLSEGLSSLKIEAFFESALVKTGKDLLDHIDKEKINFDLGKINVSVALIYEGEIYLSNSGHNKAFLLRKIKNEYEISDINPDDGYEEESEYKTGKIFSSIINGEIPNNSYIIMSNPSLSEYILRKDLIEIIDKLNIEGAKEQIKNTLKEINTYSNFSGLLIKNCLLEEKMKNNSLMENKPEFRPENNYLYQSENKTEKLLTNTGSIDKKRLSDSFGKILNKINIFRIFVTLFRKIAKNKKNHEKAKVLPEMIIDSDAKKNKSKKILAILVVALLLFLAGSFYFKKNKEQKVVEEENISYIEESINKKQSQIDSFLLYGDEIKSMETINELKTELDSLSDKEKSKINNLSEIEKKLEDQVNQIRKMVKIEEPKELSNLSVLNNEAYSSSMSVSNNIIYVADAKNGAIYSVNTSNGLSSELSKSELIKSEKILSNKDQAGNSYFLNDKYFIDINLDGKINYTKLNAEDFSNVSSFDTYNNKPYLLNKEKKQIFKYSKSGDEYIAPTAWIKDDNAKDPISIAIDYDIYILDNNGSLFKYLSGNKESFELDMVDPAINNPKFVRLSEKYIYIIESNRIIVFYKDNGAFINQYSSDKFDNLKDIAIDETNKKIYILNNNLVYEIDMIL
ncbi:hypothetical protein CVU82_02270 [Candidatus Falkowbacteria bacterium HGW-Falkowbacteria-1]|uniref:Uncharacterized protein n=1 Tax=Candidatus Falkowbacteria bacterium HGW-Falkowbacteria-1 TaxID=2013768 RepID=A0A2N2E9J0_9BACT|nr:MAG: hypothetical protein CVU82_02270 [Candidatus Falkowbacteria bacterium HGW-Falkowbacteria-1]